VNGHSAKTSVNALAKKDFSFSFFLPVIMIVDIVFEEIETF
jgi:hypothetical protein